jgi:hypothetical protein
LQQTIEEQAEAAQLYRWIGAAGDAARIESHPRFDEAARLFATTLLEAADRDPALDGIFKDAGRYVVALWAMYAHVSGGLTLPRLKEICAASGLLSPGRARALLIYLRYLGFVELWPERASGKPARYIPTSAFIAAWKNHLRVVLEATRMIEPAMGLVLARLDDPGMFETFTRFQGEQLLYDAQTDEIMKSPYVRVFVGRHAGTQLIWLLGSGGTEAVFPPVGAIPFSAAAAAKRFRVSRIHIKRMLDDAERESLLTRSPDGSVTFAENTRATIRTFYGQQLLALLHQAARTLRETDTAGQPVARHFQSGTAAALSSPA